MVLKRKIKIIKVPLEHELEIIMPNFPIMPRMYLELLENKNKVKAGLRSVEHNPALNEQHQVESIQSKPTLEAPSRTKSRNLRIVDLEESTDINKKNETNLLPPKKEPEPIKEIQQRISSSDKRPKKRIEVDTDDTVLGLFHSSNKQSENIDDDKEYFSNDVPKIQSKEENKKSLPNDGLSKLLRGNIDMNSLNEPVTFLKNEPMIQEKNNSSTIPPSLADINSNRVVNDSNGVRNMAYVTKTEEEELSKKREILYNFQKLRKLYPSMKIPEFSEHTDIKTLEREYAFIVKDLEVNSSVETYKNYLILSFKGLELLLVNYMNFEDIKGFADQQLLVINKYESILMEIGERNYIAENKKWPAEVRLLGVFLMQTAMFLGTRYAMKLMTKNTSSEQYKPSQQYHQFDRSRDMNRDDDDDRRFHPIPPKSQNTQFENLSEKRKMRGPDIDFDDFQPTNQYSQEERDNHKRNKKLN